MHNGFGDEFLTGSAFAAKNHGSASAGYGLYGLIHPLHGQTRAYHPAKNGFVFYLPDEPATLKFERALFNSARENDFEFIIVDRETKELVGAGLAGLQRDCALVATGESGENDVIPDFADLLENVKAIAGSVANGVQVEEDCVQFRLFEKRFDFAFIGSQRSSEFTAKMFANLRKELCVISDDCQ
jgi:hypothetical protein